MFQLGRQPDGSAAGAPRAYLVGPMRLPIDVRYDGPALALGVRFQPGGARAFVRQPADEVVDVQVDLSDLWRDVPALIDELGSAADDAVRVSRLERSLERHVRVPDPRPDRAAIALERSGGALGVADLVHATGLSERQLQRRFRERIGFPPRLARRIARFGRAAAMLRSAPRTAWPTLVHACGFYDQPHLIREFRAFAGYTPAEYAASVGSVQYEDASSTYPSGEEESPDRRSVA